MNLNQSLARLNEWRPRAESTVPPYEQLKQYLSQLIDDHVLPAGTKLPSVRALAGTSGLAVNTVARAIRELEESGLLRTAGRNGTLVSGAAEQRRDAVADAAREFAAIAHSQGISEAEALLMVEAALKS
ncbi:GntR family transcriptional regulator [Psychromicrobium xiongbiense]|uniref:GntR family transcriptional regulator n=1 Tax=Psychromicrobium xiongbiense TaxID=3051184 RepID=UPI0025542FC3|nr:GntR family transcriptional regulator [Psychromicrobium sp. YIM S02556]